MPIGQLGMMLAGAGLGQILAPINDRRQLRQQEKLQQLQMQGNKEMTDYNTRKQMEMWENTSYPAQMAMLKKAGLNPALMYGMGGGGGTTANLSQGNIGTGQAPTGGGEIMGMMGMGLQSQMIQAQIELTKAQTQKTQAETGNVPIEGEGMKLDNARKEIENSIAAIEETVAGQTQNMRIATYQQETEASMRKLELLRNETDVNKERLNAEIGNLWADMANKAIDIEVKEANINLTNNQIRKISREIWAIGEEISQGWESLSIQDMKNVLERKKQEWDQSGLPPMIRDIMGAVGTGVLTGMILNRIPAGKRNEIQGFKIKK